MHSFGYRDGVLHCEDVSVRDIAAEFGTPVYVYSAGTIRDHFDRLDASLFEIDHEVCYAVKANSNLAVLHLLATLGSAFDIVSGGELFRVLKAGGSAGRCTFAGVGKTRDEIAYALREGVYSFNVESEAELRAIDSVAAELGTTAPVALRVNPNVDALTHHYISTGKAENKFGIDYHRAAEVYARAAEELQHLRFRGVQMHIGSQLTKVTPFVEAIEKVAPLVAELKEAHGIEFFSVGGGLGIVYSDQTLPSGEVEWWEEKTSSGGKPMTAADYGEAVVPLLQPLGLKVLVEPGRFIVGNAGALVTRVLYDKAGWAKAFKIVDAGMNDLIRPALYQGYHQVVPVDEPATSDTETVDVVGPVCESADFFAQDRDLPPVAEGDLLAVLSAGAYGFCMASNYNSRPLPAEVMVDGSDAYLVRERQTLDDLVAGEHVPHQACHGR
jgi:diaminopimelate decarboxylase